MKKTFSILAIFILLGFIILPASSLATGSDDTSVTSFVFAGLTPAVTGTISAQTISLTVPTGTTLSALVPTITIAAGATISPASGVAQDFSSPATYTVTAEDSSTQSYTVTVTAGVAPTPKDDGSSVDLSTSGNGLTAPCPATGCAFNDLFVMVKKVINFILFDLAIPIAAIMFAYAGFELVTSGGESSKRTKAKDIFVNVALGLIFAAAAWLIVHTLLSILGYQSTWSTWFGF